MAENQASAPFAQTQGLKHAQTWPGLGGGDPGSPPLLGWGGGLLPLNAPERLASPGCAGARAPARV